MRALSVRQPWSWAILRASKTIENRVWAPRLRLGAPLLLHASKGCTRLEYESAAFFMYRRGLIAGVEEASLQARLEYTAKSEKLAPPRASAPVLPHLSLLDRGGFVGTMRFRGAVTSAANTPRTKSPGPDRPLTDVDRAWWDEDQVGWLLGDVEAMPFVAFGGELGVFDVPSDAVVRACDGRNGAEQWHARARVIDSEDREAQHG